MPKNAALLKALPVEYEEPIANVARPSEGRPVQRIAPPMLQPVVVPPRPPPPAVRHQPVVVIVDDDSITRLMIGNLLQRRGYTVYCAARLSEARPLIGQYRPDLLMIDGLLPDGTGVDFVAELRAQQNPLRVVFVSSFFRDFKTYQRLTDQLKVDGILHKPQRGEQMVSRVAGILAGPSAYAQAFGAPAHSPAAASPVAP